jgi:hypothetical protein
MADRKISDLTALTTPASGDFLPIVDISEAAAASKNKKITYSDFLNNIPTGTITSTMILDGTILNADINASAAIVDTKLATIATGGKVSNSATTATDANTASAIVARDGSGNFTAGTITANLTGTASNVTTNANLTGDVTSVGNATSIAAGVIVNADINASAAIALSKLATGALPSGITVASANIVNSTIVNTDISASAAIVDTKLATIATAGKVSNSATTATDANTASAIVARDGSGNFTAGTITAALTGAASSNVLKAGDTMTGALVVPLASAATPSLTFTGDLDSGVFSPGANQVAVATNGVGRLFVDATGLVGIGTTSPGAPLEVIGTAGTISARATTGVSSQAIQIYNNGTDSYIDSTAYGAGSGGGIAFRRNSTGEMGRFDTSGRLLVGTSTAFDTAGVGTSYVVGIEKTSGFSAISLKTNDSSSTGAYLTLGKSRGVTANSKTIVQSGDEIGGVFFEGADGAAMRIGAGVIAYIDGTPGAGDLPTRLVFSTTADGAASPTERLRITQAGNVLFGKTTTTNGVAGINLYAGTTATGVGEFTSSGDLQLVLNRLTDDGTLVDFRQDGTSEGTISVSGTTVSYNGAHLSRWSQLTSGVEREEILRGSVLSNVDEMCEWTDEENEQLNRMKVSDVEGDKNVSGVFQAWDDDDDTYTNDFYCAMTGDFIIRIAEGVTVERGDLLMSAGDGTAKPQDDDIIRSKTIAKVTSTNVSCTYADGSYCVPCVLMAC